MSIHRLASVESAGLEWFLPQPEPWMRGALCAQVDYDLFYPERGEPTTAAKRICALCPVRDECREYALDHSERWGVWGGLSDVQRRNLRKQRALAALSGGWLEESA